MTHGIKVLGEWHEKQSGLQYELSNRLANVQEHSTDPTPSFFQGLQDDFARFGAEIGEALSEFQEALGTLQKANPLDWEAVAAATRAGAELIEDKARELELVEEAFLRKLDDTEVNLSEHVIR